MDGRSSHVPQSTYRGAAAMASPAPVQHVAPTTTAHVPQQRVAHHAPPASRTTHQKKEKSIMRVLLPILIGIFAFIFGIAGTVLWSGVTNKAATYIDTDKYQAVFFTNGQVYFGKLHPAKNNRLKLTDVYYLQTQTATSGDSENPQSAITDQSNIQLIKLGDEVHGPEDAMIISEDQVLFFENLKPDGKVAQSIEKYKNSK